MCFSMMITGGLPAETTGIDQGNIMALGGKLDAAMFPVKCAACPEITVQSINMNTACHTGSGRTIGSIMRKENTGKNRTIHPGIGMKGKKIKNMGMAENRVNLPTIGM